MNDDFQRSWDFMLNEYNSIIGFRKLIIDQTEGRITYYFKMVAFVLPIMISIMITYNKRLTVLSVFVSFFMSFVIYICGLITFNHVIEGHVSIIYYTRALNKTRSYFKDNDKAQTIEKYIFLPVNENEPSFGNYGFGKSSIVISGNTNLYMILNSLSLLWALFVWAIYFANKDCSSVVIVVADIACIAAVINYLFLWKRFKDRMIEAEAKYERQREV